MRRAFANSSEHPHPPVPQSGGAPPGPDPIVTDGLVLHLDAGDASSYPAPASTGWT